MSALKSHKALPTTEWPRIDREAWTRANDPGDGFSKPGIASGWALRSRENAELAYGRMLGHLKRNDRLRPVDRVGERLVPDDLCDLGRELSAQLAPCTVCGVFSSLSMAFHAMDPAANRAFLINITSRLSRTAKSVRDIAGNLLSPPELAALGHSMMDQAEAMPSRSFRRASLYRDGLLTMFMALCPLRPGTVAEMTIGTHLLIDGDAVRVYLPIVERKKRRLEDVPLPSSIVPRFLRYLAIYRPMLPAPPSEQAQALWLSRNGNRLDRDGLSKRIKERVGLRTGKRFSAHMFRHACATYIADTAPERVLMCTGALGHSGFRTAQKYYIKGQQRMAITKYQEAATELARRGRQVRQRNRT